MLALLSRFVRWLRLDGVRALKQSTTDRPAIICQKRTIDDFPVDFAELRIFSQFYIPSQRCYVCGQKVEPFVRYVLHPTMGLRHECDYDVQQALQSANAEKSQPVSTDEGSANK